MNTSLALGIGAGVVGVAAIAALALHKGGGTGAAPQTQSNRGLAPAATPAPAAPSAPASPAAPASPPAQGYADAMNAVNNFVDTAQNAYQTGQQIWNNVGTMADNTDYSNAPPSGDPGSQAPDTVTAGLRSFMSGRRPIVPR